MHDRAKVPCLLLAEIAGGVHLAEKLGEAEAAYAVERSLNRMSRCAEAYQALGFAVKSDSLVAHFPDADSALLAAREMRERVRALPPMSGIKLVLKAGVVLETEAEGLGLDAEKLAVLLVESHGPDSIAVSENLGRVLTPSLRRLLGHAEDSVGEMPIPVLELGEAPPPSPAEQRQEAQHAQKQMRVSYRGQNWVVDGTRPALLFGRDTGNDIVISDPRVSRRHARLELRNGLFYLADSSTNGTFLLEEGTPEHCVKREEFILGEKGHIGCGFSVNDNMSDVVAFALD
ncbi:MAG: FHA domain-containing protein [Proteobacteria bacterium]|nr:FHA domain-containing protein [Pseudomonadota bacterium]